ncbi:DUF1501 domain-containing protein [Hydrogenimonas cancrithermarum]|uniref:DUF1501 domain-containing protein n=1 Tax=Hydrogenimonas cancrithermarum TaxID=2993563 RepID=A0ABM8FPD1_9BACT|nr:DUF1501 domain-containing protein [Hydrogenimonas cancrithermarum]BDY13586.1 hypothetical protein HCR_18980 [Hydrogenimonas cancrithermarum]
MKRRTFLKTSLSLAAIAGLNPSLFAETGVPLPLEAVDFDAGSDAQTIVIYLMGGMGDIIGNMTNFDQIVDENLSQIAYPMDKFTKTADGFWREAGGEYIQSMLDEGNLTVFRTCEQTDVLKAHKLNQVRFMHGNDQGYESGIVTTLMHVLGRFNAVPEDAFMTNVSFVDSNFELLTDNAVSSGLPSHLKPVSFGLSVKNPFARKAGLLYQDDDLLDRLSFEMNARAGNNAKIGRMFSSREDLEAFMENLASSSLPSGIDYTIGGTYDKFNFGKQLEVAMRILVENPDTKVVSMTTESWDDHSNAIAQHTDRGYHLFRAVHMAMEHAKALGNENINIVLFGDFGRNLNINSAYGWDHGNNQCVYFIGGKKHFNHRGIVGETVLDETMLSMGRIYTTPAPGSYKFEPYAIASTLYKLYGVKNPEVLTGGRKAIGDELDVPFLKG